MAAEGVGLAASVAGLVSLGLQVTGGIVKYVDAFENREKDLAFVKQQNEAIRATLRAINGTVVAHGPSPELAATVSGSMQSFKKEFDGIDNLCAELVDSSGKNWISRLDNRRKRFSYPFNRPKIQELGRRLDMARGTLQLTLNALDMRISRQHHTETLATMEVSFRGLSSETQLIRSSLSAVETPIIDIKEQLSTTHEAVNASTRLLVSHYGTIAYQAQESNQVFLGKFQETTNLVQRLAELCSKQHQETIETIERLALQTQQNHRPDCASVALVRRLAGKPALLKEVGNTIQIFEQAQDQVVAFDLPTKPLHTRTQITASSKPPMSHYILGRICICPRQRRLRERRWIQLGDSSFFGEWETQTHWHACPLSRKSGKKRRVVLGFSYIGLAHVMKTAINMSFELTYGAGGFSISPIFACIPTVDDTLDPAFRILGLVEEGFVHFRNGPERLMLVCMERLIRLFDDRKVCATAVNQWNQSLMHEAIFSLSEAELKRSVGAANAFLELVQTLLSYGVAPFSYDKWGISPMLEVQPWMFDSKLVQPVLKVLLQANLESQPVALNASSIDSDTHISIPTSDIQMIYGSVSGLAEACECGPLSMAVIQNDTVAVVQILNRNPGAMKEINIYGQSPFHLAAIKSPWILELLLRTGDQSLLDHRDISGFTALEIAMIHSSDVCINEGGIQRCNGDECGCCQCIDLLLAAGCSVRMHRLDESHQPNAPELCFILVMASELARRKYVFHMKKSRTANQSPHPRELSSIPKFEVTDDSNWIFNEIADPHLGALFYRHGFEPHSSSLMNLQWKYSKFRDIMNFPYLHWLMSHGVDILSRSPKGPALLKGFQNCGLFGAHFAFHFIELDFLHDAGHKLLVRRSDESGDTSVELTTEIFRRNLTDGCQCQCTAGGCTPFTWMMKGNIFMRDTPDRSPRPPSLYAGVFSSHYSECGPELITLTYKAAIRYATFTALNLSHTCCGAWDISHYGHERVQRDANDIKTINEKQATLLETLEDLVLQFEEKAVAYLGTDSKSGQGTFDKFWSEYWERRMDEKLAKLYDKESKDAERGAQGNGIHSWGPQRPVNVENPYDKETDLKYWMYELDKICPEYSEPWPEDQCRIVEEP